MRNTLMYFVAKKEVIFYSFIIICIPSRSASFSLSSRQQPNLQLQFTNNHSHYTFLRKKLLTYFINDMLTKW